MTFLETDWDALTLTLLGIGLCAGTLAVLVSFWGQRRWATGLAISGLAVSLILSLVVSVGKNPTVYLLLAAPAAIGGVALALNTLLRSDRNVAPKQITITVLLFLTAVVAAALGMVKATQVPVFQERDAFLNNLRQMEGIAEVTLPGDFGRDGWYPQAIIISLEGYPGSKIVLHPHYQLKTASREEPLSELVVRQLGPHRFYSDIQYEKNGSWGRPRTIHGLHLGTQGIYRDQIPVEVECLGDIIDHYQQLAEYFEYEWPRKSMPGKLETSARTFPMKASYWLEKDSSVPIPRQLSIKRKN